jgi:hypothetical protein
MTGDANGTGGGPPGTVVVPVLAEEKQDVRLKKERRH